MDLIQSLKDLLHDPGIVIRWGGYPALALVIFAETGALVFFLPGDSLLVIAGLLARQGLLNILWLNLLLIPLAILGDATSYFIGTRLGPRLFSRPKSRFFNPKHIQAAHEFYERHGGKAIILARFVPVMRTFVPVVAGVAQMTYRRFGAFNVIGGASWVLSMTLIGFLLGGVDLLIHHTDAVVVGIVFLSILPPIIEYLRARRRASKATAE
jgi:membrane-associated protein